MVQEKHAAEVVSRYGMAAAKTVSTPFEPGSSFGVEEVPVAEGVIPLGSAIRLDHSLMGFRCLI